LSGIGGIIVKRIVVIITLILCVGAIIFGNLHWKNKITAQGEEVTNTVEAKAVTEAAANQDVSDYFSNLPESVQNKIKDAQSSGQPLQFVIYGSNATSDEKGAWPAQLTKQLEDTYGTNVFQVSVISEGEKTSLDVVREKSYKQVSELKPDIVLFEPFMLKDNGLIGVSNTLDNIETMMNSWKSANDAVTIMVQPPNPLYSATYYPKEVKELQEYAKQNNLTYLNHWEAWPDLEDSKMKDYLTEESNVNENGNKIWADFLIKYFIAK
jgi:hypothetical protein